MKFTATTFIAIAALIAGIFSMLYQRRSVIAQTGNGSPFVINNGAPVFNIGGRSPAATGTGVPLPSRLSGLAGCGCGGSYGDYAVPKLNPIFGETLQVLPYTEVPQVNDPRLPLIGNGAMIQ